MAQQAREALGVRRARVLARQRTAAAMALRERQRQKARAGVALRVLMETGPLAGLERPLEAAAVAAGLMGARQEERPARAVLAATIAMDRVAVLRPGLPEVTAETVPMAVAVRVDAPRAAMVATGLTKRFGRNPVTAPRRGLEAVRAVARSDRRVRREAAERQPAMGQAAAVATLEHPAATAQPERRAS